MVLQSAQHRRHASAAPDAHDSRSALADAVVVDALQQARRVGRQHVGERAVQADEAVRAERAADHEADSGADEQRHELQRRDRDPVGENNGAVGLGKRESDAERHHDEAGEQNQEPAFDVQAWSQQLQHGRDQVITRDATKLTTLTVRAPRNAAPKPATATPPPWTTVASQKTMAFTMSVNRPRVIRLRGRVSNRRMGRTKALSTPRITAKIKTVTTG